MRPVPHSIVDRVPSFADCPVPALVAALLMFVAACTVSPTSAQAQELTRAERRCRATLARASRRYLDQTMGARQDCERMRIQGRVDAASDCLAPAGALGHDRTRLKLERATTRLSQDIAGSCTGIDLVALGFPGSCTIADAASGELDAFDVFQCTVETIDETVARLLHVSFPGFAGPFGSGDTRCVQAVNERGRRMVNRALRARHDCMIQKEKGRFGLISSVDCREPVPPYGAGTGNDATDSGIVAAYRSLLTKVPTGCASANVRAMYGGNGCADSTGGGFNVFDLQLCVFNMHRGAGPELLELAFPSPPACGNAIVEGFEECDLGADNGSTGPCLADCRLAACGDGLVCAGTGCTTGPGGGAESCDDGNSSSADSCLNDCSQARCGDSVVCGVSSCTTGPSGGPEQCDDGATGDSGPCLADCTAAICGDDEVCTGIACSSGPDGGPEACDDAGASVDCNADCSPSLCGDTKINPTDDEECDDGFVNNRDEPNACRSDCKLPRCDDGIVDDERGEECDPPNGFSCDGSCRLAACGNGQVDGVCGGDLSVSCESNADCASAGGVCNREECDDGPANSDTTPNACRGDCTLPACGDGVVDDESAEICDAGAANSDAGSCLLDCSPAHCGDEKTCSAPGCDTGPGGGPEQCDAGDASSDTEPDICRSDCSAPSCGDGVRDTGEECDSGEANSDSAPDACRTDCREARCGDGVRDFEEECDDAADSDSGPCTSVCRAASCGDGLACTAAACTSGIGGGPEGCDDAGESVGCDPDCSPAVCGDQYINTSAGEQCDLGSATGSGSGCTDACLCEAGAEIAGCVELQCPGKAEVVIYAGVGAAECSSDEECPVPRELGGGCDADLGRCVTQTSLDTGWTGIAHGADIDDLVRGVGTLSCPGPFDPDSPEPCGVCEITGLSVETDSCRCNTDLRTICDEKFATDLDDCGIEGVSCVDDLDCRVCNVTKSISCFNDDVCPDGEFCLNGLFLPTCDGGQCVGKCDCYLGPPLPLSAGNTPACVLNRFASDVSGTNNVDTGQGALRTDLRSIVFTGERLTVPCPVCAGSCAAPVSRAGRGCVFDQDCDVAGGDGACGNFDPVPDDGVRGGTCFLGGRPDESCDVTALNASFPAPGGGGYSLDCPPNQGKNISGLGLIIQLEQSTGSVQLESKLQCGFPFPTFDLCPCGQCKNVSEKLPCSSNADCGPSGGPCERLALGRPTNHRCSNSNCIVDPEIGGNNGICESDFVTFCDGVVRANGEGFVSCGSGTDAECIASDCGPPGCGSCTLRKSRSCFLPTITAQGQAHPTFPVGAATFCIVETGNSGIDGVAGLPGPGRILNQTRSRTFCAGDPSVEYLPGVGGCPAP